MPRRKGPWHPVGPTAEQRRRYLAVLEQGGTLAAACDAIGVHTRRAFAWRQQDATFDAEVRQRLAGREGPPPADTSGFLQRATAVPAAGETAAPETAAPAAGSMGGEALVLLCQLAQALQTNRPLRDNLLAAAKAVEKGGEQFGALRQFIWGLSHLPGGHL